MSTVLGDSIFHSTKADLTTVKDESMWPHG